MQLSTRYRTTNPDENTRDAALFLSEFQAPDKLRTFASSDGDSVSEATGS
jgi:hypothetical protein